MPAYNFQPRFASDVRWSRKRQTIRIRRTRPTKPGETLQLYTKMRTKFCEKLGEGRCTAVHPVEIWESGVKVGLDNLSRAQIEDFARADGFADSNDFYKFWRATHGLAPGEPCLGLELIQWEPTRMIRLEIDYLGGLCPVQAEGRIGHKRFYFKARADHWWLHLSDGEDSPLNYAPYRTGPYGKFPEAGYMPESEARKIIADIAREIEEKPHAARNV